MTAGIRLSLARLHPNSEHPHFYYIIGFVPIVLDFDIGVISDITITVGSITKFMIVLSLLRLPRYAGLEKSDFYISNAQRNKGILDLCVIIFSGFMSSVELPLPLLAANLAVVAFAFVFGRVRFNSGKVNVESAMLPDSENSGLQNMETASLVRVKLYNRHIGCFNTICRSFWHFCHSAALPSNHIQLKFSFPPQSQSGISQCRYGLILSVRPLA